MLINNWHVAVDPCAPNGRRSRGSAFEEREPFPLLVRRGEREVSFPRIPTNACRLGERGDARAKRAESSRFLRQPLQRARTHAHTHAVIAIGRLTNQRGERIAVPILHAVSPRVSRARASSFYRIGRPQGTGGEGERVALPGEQGSQWIRISRSSGGIVRRLFLFLSSPRRFFRRSSPLLGAEAVSRSPLHPSAGIFYAHAWICL